MFLVCDFVFLFLCWDIEISVSSPCINFINVSSCSFSNWCSHLRSSTYVIVQAIKGKQFLLPFRILEAKRCWVKAPVQIQRGGAMWKGTSGRQNCVCLACVVLTLRRHLFSSCVVTWLPDENLSLQSCVELCADVWSSTWHHWDAKIRVHKKEN